MTKAELVQNADKQSYEYNTKYSEDYTLKDMLKRPQDFVEGTIENIIDLLKKKAYRDGLIDSAEPREKRIADLEETINKLREQLALRYDLEDKVKNLETQIVRMKSAVISERDEALRVEDVITYGVLNGIIDKWEAEGYGR